MPDTYIHYGPDGHAYWLEPTAQHYDEPPVELWACPVMRDGQLDLDNRFWVGDSEVPPALAKALLEALVRIA